jgi:hypothetical protein
LTSQPASALQERVRAAIAHLLRVKDAKPKSQKTLRGTLHALFDRGLSEQELTALFAALCERGIVKIDGNNLKYDLPLPA